MAIKVRVLRGVQAGLTGMSGLVALSSGVAACTAEPATDDAAASDESALNVQNPGTGVFTAWEYVSSTGLSFAAMNGPDEYVRAGEKMSFTIPLYLLWDRIHPDLVVPDDPARLKQLSAKVKVVSTKDGGGTSSTTVATNGTFEGSQTYDLSVHTGQFTVNKKAQSLGFEIVISDAGDATKHASIAATDLPQVAVIGGSLPNKTALFDTLGSGLRQRVLEGGKPVAGSNLAFAYTDWRAATLVDSASIDRNIGNATSYGRFGAFTMPISGDLEYEITYSVAIDGVWQNELPLTYNAKSRLMPWLSYGRAAYEGVLSVPAGAKKLEVYFHVKTFLVVDYDKFSQVGERRFAQGDRILVREKWDNENGAYGDNYDFTTETK